MNVFRGGLQNVACAVTSRLSKCRTPIRLQFRHTVQTTRTQSTHHSKQPIVAPAVGVASDASELENNEEIDWPPPKLNSVKPKWTRSKWTAAEDARLIQMRSEKHPLRDICAVFNRTKFSIKARSREMLKMDASADDNILKARRDGLSWQQLSDAMPAYSMRQIRQRHSIILQQAVDGGAHQNSQRSIGRYSAEEDRKLMECRQQAMSFAEVAKAMGSKRTVQALATRYRVLMRRESGLQDGKTRHQHWWSESEQEKLQSMIDEGVKLADVAAVLGKPVRSVRAKLESMRNHENVYLGVKTWSKGENELLSELVEAGQKPGEISKRMGRTLSSVHGRLTRLRKLQQSIGGKE